MNLEQVNRVRELDEERKKLCTLLKITVIKLPLGFMDGLVSPDHVLAGIHHGALSRIVKIDEALKRMGVRVPHPMKSFDDDAPAWQREHLMYKNAWQRELGGALLNKSHEIDAYVVTTARMKERADSLGECVEALCLMFKAERTPEDVDKARVVLSRMDDLKRRQC